MAVYGPFAPFALLTLYIIKLLWDDNKRKEAEIRRLSDVAMEKVMPTMTVATQVISDSINIIKSSAEDKKQVVLLMEKIEHLDSVIPRLERSIKNLENTISQNAPPAKPTVRKRTQG